MIGSYPKPADFSPGKGQNNMTIPEIENKVFCMDCIAGMAMLPDASIDMILCDLPYGVTDCVWDKILPMEELWQQYERVIKPNGTIVLTAIQPFTTQLIASKRKLFRYCWYWRKNHSTGFALSHRQPMRCIEDIAVFYKKQPTYHPQGLIRLDKPRESKGGKSKGGSVYKELNNPYISYFTNYPSNLLEIPAERGLHPTQKPAALFEYLIRTYTNPGEIVLDNCMGSGTTAVACIRCGRRFVGFELDEAYWELCQKRIEGENKSTRF